MGGYKITEKGLNGEFTYQYLRQGLGYLGDITTTKTSNQAIETYAGLGTVPTLAEFKGQHQYSTLGEDSYVVPNKQYTGGVEFDKFEWLEDKQGIAAQRAGELASAARDFQEQLAVEVVLGSALGYDGKALFATDHVTRNSGSQSNSISNNITTTTAPTVVEMRASIFLAIQALLAFKDDQARYMNRDATQFMILVPVPYLEAALGAVANPIIGAETNTLQNQNLFQLNVVAEPLITWTTAFAVLCTNKMQKPIWLQTRRDVETHTLAEDSEYWKTYKRARFGVEWNGTAVPGWWQTAVKVTHT